jgi:hypothetical protein
MLICVWFFLFVHFNHLVLLFFLYAMQTPLREQCGTGLHVYATKFSKEKEKKSWRTSEKEIFQLLLSLDSLLVLAPLSLDSLLILAP